MSTIFSWPVLAVMAIVLYYPFAHLHQANYTTKVTMSYTNGQAKLPPLSKSRQLLICILMSPILSWSVLVVVTIVFYHSIAYILQSNTSKGSKSNKNVTKLPPGPKGIPILGNLLMLGELPHHGLHELSKQYGPIMFLRLGFVPTIVVSSPWAAEEFLRTHDLTFASRPFTEAAKYMSYDTKGMTFSKYGSYWRSMRKICTLQLLSNHKIDSFRPVRRHEMELMVQSMKKSAIDGELVDLSAKVASLTTDITCLMVFGKKYEDKEFDERGFKAVIHEGMQLGATFNVADYIPYAGVFDIQGLGRRMKAVSKVYDDFFEKIIDEHMFNKNTKENQDFVDVMLSLMESGDTEIKIERDNVKAVILDMLAGGLDTSATAIEWALSEMFRHPQVLKKAQDELQSVVGMTRIVEESDLPHLEYLDMVIKESLRLHPVGPLLIPHEAIQDCTINGFHIPSKSRIIVNTYAIGRDPTAWPNPDEFSPERFVGDDVDIRGRDFRLLPFGSGRRSCPGMHMGLTVTRLVLAQLVHCFDWELPGELDMREEFGLTCPRAKHLMATPSYRLQVDV